MLSPAQIKKIWLLSDTVLYRDALNFMQQLLQKPKSAPLSTKQANGLLNSAQAASYGILDLFVARQNSRDWLTDKISVQLFYADCSLFLTNMRRKRLRDEFRLLSDETGRPASEIKREEDELMLLLAREFIQHLVAENGLLLAQQEDEKSKERGDRNIHHQRKEDR